MRTDLALLLAAALIAAACDDDEDDVRIEEFEDEGALCLRSLADARVLHVRAVFPTCLSSSCSVPIGSTCEVIWDGGDTLRIDSFGSAEHRRGGACTDDCGTLEARCQSEPLAPGEYTVEYGDRTAAITLPIAEQRELFGGGPGSCDPRGGRPADGGDSGA